MLYNNQIYETNKHWFYIRELGAEHVYEKNGDKKKTEDGKSYVMVNPTFHLCINYPMLKAEYDKIQILKKNTSFTLDEMQQKVENIINFYNEATFRSAPSTAGGRRKTRRSRRQKKLAEITAFRSFTIKNCLEF